MTSFTGTWTLIRFILRRDRLRLAIWILGIVGFFVLIAASFPNIYPTPDDRQGRAAFMDNPTAKAFRGPGHGLDDYTYGAMLSHELMGYAAIAVALMSIFLVVRHTRTEEESGRLELIRATVVGRYAAPAAALIVVLGANLVIAGLFATLLPIMPGDYPVAGSLAFGLALGSVGLVFAGVAALTAQLTEYGRGASSMAVTVLGVAYLLRAIGDINRGFLSWLSPIGWAQATRAFVDEQWFPLGLVIGLAGVLTASAFTLLNRRDVAAGIVPQKPGPANASAFTSHPVGFVLRQQAGSIIGWAVGLVILGIAFGSLASEIEEFIAENPQLAEFMAAADDVSLLKSFLGLVMLIMALLTSGFAISSAMRARQEEGEGRAEPILATSISRRAWLASYLLVSVLGSGAILLAGGLSLGVMAAIDQDDVGLLTGALGAVVAFLPAVWLLVGLIATLFGMMPRLLALPWLVLIYGFFVGLFGEQVQLPGWMFQLSPFEHVPDMPAAQFAVIPFGVMLLLAGFFLLIGLQAFRRRDLEMS